MYRIGLSILLALFAVLSLTGLSLADDASVRKPLPEGIQRPVQVHLVVRILDVLKIEETTGEAQIGVEIQQRWRDPTQTFNPIAFGRDRQDFAGREAAERTAVIWTPSIIIENQIGDGKVQLEALSVRSTGDVTLTRRLEGSFRFAKDLSAFPFDMQRLPLSFVSQFYPADDLVFVLNHQDRQLSTIPDELSASDWDAKSLTFTTAQFYGWSARPFARMTAEMVIDRKWPRYFLRIFVPFMAVLSVSLFILWSPKGLIGDKTGVTYSALLALAALSFTFEASFPGSMSVTSPIAFMISIGYFYLILALLVDLLLESKSLPGRLAFPYLPQEARVAVRYLMPALFIIICIGITLRSMA
ncbi:neurotransmitter-gated ion-channel ligand-binding protein [Rhizobium sp. FY34]|uniref:neurotransmitter-gated ion-channel ligand-binding protein n=1 Tax=Rhizobium sp. FY34 TaxID=2562309 RepID=UPI00148528F9|nr:neurotransmitter-gated ion-channel ligand-binding protein [Rhizobium sp. FY34]